MKRLLLGAAGTMLAISVAAAQTTTNTGAQTTPNSMSAAPSGKAAASGDSNQAVATTSANADQPAKGANSFTKRQAMKRLQAKGYSSVSGLMKDHDGVWRGTGMKDGQSVQIWLDYKGNVGQQS